MNHTAKTLSGQVIWVTGAGSGIGEAAAETLAAAGAVVILSGRRAEKLQHVAQRIAKAGGVVHVKPADVSNAEAVTAVAAAIGAEFGRLDVLVNNAGLNIAHRRWTELTPAGVDDVVGANLRSAFYCVAAVLPMMRKQGGGLLIHTASFAGRFVSALSGPAYTAAKHGVVAMSHSINMEECVNNIRSTAVCPGEVATPILDKRPVPVSAEDRARMVQPEDCARLIRFIAETPAHVCLNEVLISPTHNRSYVAALARSGA